MARESSDVSSELRLFARRLLSSLELYVEMQDLKNIGLTDEEIFGWLELAIDDYIHDKE